MRHTLLLTLLFLASPCAFAAKDAGRTKVTSLEEIVKDPKLIGQVVEVETCAGIPLDDGPDARDLLILYPCDTDPSDASEKSVIGLVSAKTKLIPPKEWNIGDSASFKGRFRGILQKSELDFAGGEKLLAIRLSEVEFYSPFDP